MKRLTKLLLLLLPFYIFSCSKEEILIEQPEEEVPQPNVPEPPSSDSLESTPHYLMIEAQISNMTQSRINIVNHWVPGMEIAVLSEDNQLLKFQFNGNAWESKQKYDVQSPQQVFAIFPYQNQISGGHPDNLQVDLTKQQDLLFGRSNVTPDYPKADLNMQHKLSLVRVKLLRDEYIGKGHIDKMVFEHVPTYATLNLSDGSISASSMTGEYQINQATSLDAQDEITAEMVIPSNGKCHLFSFNLDGKRLSFSFPEQHEWKPGMIYTYTLKMKGGYNCEVNVDDVPLDVDYWSTYGKTDDIRLKNIDFSDLENSMFIKASFTQFGYDCYQNEGKVFGTYYYHMGSNVFNGRMRFVLTQGGKIVEKFPPIKISRQGTWQGIKMPCYVTATPGNYTLEPLFQRNGDNFWFRAAGFDAGDERDFQVTVLPPADRDIPLLRYVKLFDQSNNFNDLSYNIPYNKEFEIDYILANKEGLPLEGELKVTWEREFDYTSNCRRPCNRRPGTINDNEWVDEIGRMSVSVPAGVKYWKGLVKCKVSKFYEMPKSENGVEVNGPIIHLYWRNVNSQDWKLLRLDAVPLFVRDHDGFYAEDVAVNYINVSLADWYAK